LRYPIAGPVTVILLSEQVEHRRHIGWDHFSELRPHLGALSFLASRLDWVQVEAYRL
jgi:hypothetical protein